MLESNQNRLEGADAERLRASLLSDDINEVVGSLDVFNGSMSDSSKSEGGEQSIALSESELANLVMDVFDLNITNRLLELISNGSEVVQEKAAYLLSFLLQHPEDATSTSFLNQFGHIALMEVMARSSSCSVLEYCALCLGNCSDAEMPGIFYSDTIAQVLRRVLQSTPYPISLLCTISWMLVRLDCPLDVCLKYQFGLLALKDPDLVSEVLESLQVVFSRSDDSIRPEWVEQPFVDSDIVSVISQLELDYLTMNQLLSMLMEATLRCPALLMRYFAFFERLAIQTLQSPRQLLRTCSVKLAIHMMGTTGQPWLECTYLSGVTKLLKSAELSLEIRILSFLQAALQGLLDRGVSTNKVLLDAKVFKRVAKHSLQIQQRKKYFETNQQTMTQKLMSEPVEVWSRVLGPRERVVNMALLIVLQLLELDEANIVEHIVSHRLLGELTRLEQLVADHEAKRKLQCILQKLCQFPQVQRRVVVA